MAAEAGTDRVQRHIPVRLEQLRIARDVHGHEAPREEMSPSLVFPVEPLCVRAAEMLHSHREIRLGCVHDDVEVRAHEAVAEAIPFVRRGYSFQLEEEALAVSALTEDRVLCNCERRDVVDRIGKVDAELARHPSTVGVGCPGVPAPRAIRHQLDTAASQKAGVRPRPFERCPQRAGSDPGLWRRYASRRRSTNGRMPPWRRYSRSTGVSRRSRARNCFSSARTVTSRASPFSTPSTANSSRPERPSDSAFSPSMYCSGRMPIISRFERWIRSYDSAIAARTPSRFGPFAAQSRDEPEPYSLPARTTSGVPSSRYRLDAS